MPRTIRTCNHVFIDGHCCESPALRDSYYCYWHATQRNRQQRRQRVIEPQQKNASISLPPLEDANSIQVAVEEVAQAIVDGHLDTRRAGLVLYALQIATTNRANITQLDPNSQRYIVRPQPDDPNFQNDPTLSQTTREGWGNQN